MKSGKSSAYFLMTLTSVIVVGFLIAGCNANKEDTEDDQSTALPERKIWVNLLVVDDDKLGPVIVRQYNSRRSGEVKLTEMSWDELVADDFQAVSRNDMVIYPSGKIGYLASRDLLGSINEDNSPVDDTLLRSLLFSDKELATHWGDQNVALSLGQSHWVMLCRQDVLDQLKIEPPKSWKDFSKLCLQLNDTSTSELTAADLPNSVAIPLKDHWASSSFFLRTASAIRLPGKYSTFFDVQTMEPLIEGEPWLRSLQGWKNDLGSDVANDDPSTILKKYSDGKLAIAIVPLNQHWLDNTSESLPPTRVCSIPGWISNYDYSRDKWTAAASDLPLSVPLTGCNGMLVSLTKTSEQARNVIEVMSWMTDKKISSIISRETPNAGLSRKSHLGNAGQWMGPAFTAEHASQFSDNLTQMNDARRMLVNLRIDESDQYLTIVDDVVRSVLLDQENEVEGLAKAVGDWKKLTESLGLEKQKQSYRRSEGLPN